MTFKLGNRVQMAVSAAAGTGTVSLAAATSGFQSFAAAGIANGDTVPYLIEDDTNWEIGVGTYSSTGPTLARTTVLASSNSGAKIAATAMALVMISPSAADLQSTDTLTAGTLPIVRGGTGGADAATARGNLGLAIGSNIQAWDADLDAIAALAGTSGFLKKTGANTWTLDTTAYLSGTVAIANGGTGATDAATARGNLGVAIGSNVQAWDGDLDAIAALAGTSGFLKKTAANTWALDTTAYLSGTVAVANGGTGATDAATARTNLGLALGSNVQAWDADLDAIAALAGTSGILMKTAANTWALDTTAYLSGTVAVGNGGTGLTSLTAGYVPYGAGTGAFASSASFTFDGTNLGVPRVTGSTDIRAPIFYDSANTAYYCDPNANSQFYQATFANRLYANEWIQLSTANGLYSATNAAYLKVNDGTYGAWKITGARNAWNGIEFDSTTLMFDHTNDNYGFHRNGTGWRFYCSGGSGHFPGNVVAYWSDQRLKENLRPIGKEAIDIIRKIVTYRFNWNDRVAEFGLPIEVGKEEIGLIAQQVQAALPDAVVVNQAANRVNEDGTQETSDYLTINYNKLTPVILQALNEALSEIADLRHALADRGIV